VCSLLLASCEVDYTEELNRQLEAAEPRLAIEARLWTLPEYAGLPQGYVLVSRTSSVFDPLNVQWVTDATVVMADDAGHTDTLLYVPLPDSLAQALQLPNGIGAYVALNLQPVVGRTYTCTVWVQGTAYTSTTQLLPPFVIDSLRAEFEQANGPREEGWRVYNHYQDPPETGDYRLSRYILNGDRPVPPDGVFLASDEFINGNYIRVAWPRSFDPGDTVVWEIHKLTKPLFDYFEAWEAIAGGEGGPFDGPAANPPGHWSNDALGYFWCSEVERDTIVIPN
jgi:hypothetical protein